MAPKKAPTPPLDGGTYSTDVQISPPPEPPVIQGGLIDVLSELDTFPVTNLSIAKEKVLMEPSLLPPPLRDERLLFGAIYLKQGSNSHCRQSGIILLNE
jgi:hypothetical protein